MSRVCRGRAAAWLCVSIAAGCHLVGGAGDLDFEASSGGAGGDANSGAAGGVQGGNGGGGGVGGGNGGGGAEPVCGNGKAEAGELCFGAAFSKYPTSAKYALDMVVVDCDNDGTLDVIAACEGPTGFDSFVAVLRGISNGLAASTKVVSAIEPPLHFEVGQRDGDADLELLAAGSDGINGVFISHQMTGCTVNAGTSPVTLQGTPADVELVRFNGDVYDDPAAITMNGLARVESYNSATSSSSGIVMSAGSLGNMAAGLLTGDSLLDLAFADPSANKVLVMWNTGIGFEQATSYTVGTFPVAVAIGDVDGTEGNDLVVVNMNASSVSILLNLNGSGSFNKTATDLVVEDGDVVAALPRDVALADMDSDGDLDIVTANASDTTGVSSVSLFLNDGTGSFELASTLSTSTVVETNFPLEIGRQPIKVLLADMNNDGALDIVTSGVYVDNTNTSYISILLANP